MLGKTSTLVLKDHCTVHTRDVLEGKTIVLILTILFSTVFLLPNVMPQAHAAANANLFVSAENSQYNNYFAGPQVIQVIVSDPDINRLDQAYGEPTVTVNGKKLRMAQATDGNWYAYFADSKQAQNADSTVGLAGTGLDFGQFCSAKYAMTATGVDFSETKGVAIANSGAGSVNGQPNPGETVNNQCSALATGPRTEHVVRESKALNGQVPQLGQIGYLNANVWPVIQLYDFASLPSAVQVQYQKAGGVQTVNLTFDRIPTNLIGLSLDRSSYTTNANVFVTMNDPQLNIDPTEEDSWTFAANTANPGMFYQAFNRNGVNDADGTTGMSNLAGQLSYMMFNHNGKFTAQAATGSTPVIDFQKNGKQIITPTRGNPAAVRTLSIGTGSEPITFIESGGVNTGNFQNWDGGKNTNVITVNDPSIRGQSALIRYNDISTSIVGGFSFATISQTAVNNTWASGQRVPVTLTDSDANKNAKITEHLNLYDPAVTRFATLKIGTPFSLSSSSPAVGGEQAAIIGINDPLARKSSTSNGLFRIPAAIVASTYTQFGNLAVDESFSFRPIIIFTNSSVATSSVIPNNGLLVIDLKTTAQKLFSTINNPLGNAPGKFKGFNFLNYDLRSLSSLAGSTGGSITGVKIFLVSSTSSILPGLSNTPTFTSLVNVTNLQGFVNLNGTQTLIGGEADATAQQVLKNIFAVVPSANIGIAYQFTISGGSITLPNTGQPLVTDFFSVGITGDGVSNAQRIDNGIYRFELEETGDNTGIFTGTNQYVMLNQLNVFDPSTYSTLRTIQHDVKFIAIQNMLQSEAPQVNYLDLGQDGVNTQISAKQEISTHTGVVSFDAKTYNTGELVTINLTDSDLNVDNDLIDIYTTVPNNGNLAMPQDIATDTIGKAGLGNYSDGQGVGILLNVKFGPQGIRWSNSIIPGDPHHQSSCFIESGTGTNGGYATSLSATGFSLIETGPSTGIFLGTFQMPDLLCQDGTIVSSITQTLSADYFDFNGESGGRNNIEDQTLAFPLTPGNIRHNYTDGTFITIPFVAENNTSLNLNYPAGTDFPEGDLANFNNTIVPMPPRPLDPQCIVGTFYADTNQCLSSPTFCPNGDLPTNGSCFITHSKKSAPQCPQGTDQDNIRHICLSKQQVSSPDQCPSGQVDEQSHKCSSSPICPIDQSTDSQGNCIQTEITPSSPTFCLNHQQSNSAGFCPTDPQCTTPGYQYNSQAKLCTPVNWDSSMDCGEPESKWLYQEGWRWVVPSGITTHIENKANTIILTGVNHHQEDVTFPNSTGFVVKWKMPNGTLEGDNRGIFYNPVNFFYNRILHTPYYFLQIDYGIGKVLGHRQGWIMTYEPGNKAFAFLKLDGVPIKPGSNYWVSAAIEPISLADPPVYVVQIIQGHDSWLYKIPLDSIEPKQNPVYGFSSFQDEYIQNGFSSSLSNDEIFIPTILSIDQNNKIQPRPLITSAEVMNQPNHDIDWTNSFNFLAPHSVHKLPYLTSIFTSPKNCGKHGIVSNEMVLIVDGNPKSNNTGGSVTQLPQPDGNTGGTGHSSGSTSTVPEFGSGSIILPIMLAVTVLFFILLRWVSDGTINLFYR